MPKPPWDIIVAEFHRQHARGEFSFATFADKVELAPMTIHAAINGKSIPSLPTAEAIAKGLGLSLEVVK